MPWWSRLTSDLVHVDWRVLTILRVVLIVLLAALVVRALRRAPAQQRHAVWALTLVLCGALPFIGVWAAAPARESARLAVSLGGAAIPVAGAALVIWLFGALAVVARTAAGLFAIHRMRALAEPLREPPWDREVEDARVRLGIRTPVDIRRSGSVRVPVAFGLRRPVVLVPLDCSDWTSDQRRAVIMHELAHVARGDWVAQLLERALCAAYWFHPLVWWAAARRRREAERACDETVVGLGMSRRLYASLLLSFAERRGIQSPPPAIALAGSNVRELELRIRGVLSSAAPRDRRRGVLSAFALVGTTVASLALSSPAPVCAMTQAALADRGGATLQARPTDAQVERPR